MKVIFSLVIVVATLIIPAAFVFAEVKYIPMVGLPRLDPNAQTTEQYVQALFFLSIAAAAMLAFIKILFGGVKWMLSDVITDKASAKKDIQGAIFGLLIVLSAYVVLNTINPQLLELNILQSAPSLTGIDRRSHDQIREDERNDNPVIQSTFSGQYGSAEHIQYVMDCLDDGGRVVMSSEDSTVVECRTKE